MTIKLTVGPRFDTRGLPEGYDPHKLYEYRYETFKPANGLESFVHKLMPVSVFKSVAFAIDPTYRFKVSGSVVTPTNRERYRATASVLDVRKRTSHVYDHTYAHTQNYGGVSFCWSPGLDYQNLYDASFGPDTLQAQPVLADVIKDTTRRTRLLGSSEGELEFFKHNLISTSRSARETRTLRGYFDGTYPPNPACEAVGGRNGPEGPFGQDVEIRYDWQGHSAVFPQSTYDTLVTNEVEFNKALALKYSVSMLKGVGPFNRDYSLLRNAIELRDLPRSILQLQKTMESIRKIFDTFGRSSSTRDLIFDLKQSSKNIPSEWLSFHFGWRQTYNDLVELLNLPEKLSKRINFLMARSQKATTFRSKRVHLSGADGVSGFQYDTATNIERNYSTSSRIERESEVRLVVNAIFDFPPINVPSLRSTYFWWDKAGITPRFIDIYNLVPWTWLYDWATGCGNYLELMEEINHDPSLINWGFFTVHTKGKVISDYYSECTNIKEVRVNGVTTEYKTGVNQNRHQSSIEFECRTRQDIASIYDVKRTSVPSSLTAYQHSILGAILAQASGFSRKGAFRPST